VAEQRNMKFRRQDPPSPESGYSLRYDRLKPYPPCAQGGMILRKAIGFCARSGRVATLAHKPSEAFEASDGSFMRRVLSNYQIKK